MATTTTHMAMQKPADGEYGWSQMLRDNADKVDSRLGAEHNADGTHGTVNSPSVIAPSMTLGGVQRSTWPSAGSASVAIDDVLKNGHISNRDVVLGRYGVSAIDFALPIPAANIVDHDFFDNTQDAAWIDQCADKSWETEHIALGKQYLAASYANDAAALAAVPAIVNGDVYYTGSVFHEYGVGVTTRAGSRKFAMRGFVTAEAARVIIWDITSGQPEMWMVFNAVITSVLWNVTLTSIAVMGGNIVVGTSTDGIKHIRFIWDDSYVIHASAKVHFIRGLSARNAGAYGGGDFTTMIINATVNSVAITYLPDAPLDDYGMRVPTIVAGTAGGTSQIGWDGVSSESVWDITGFLPVTALSIINSRLVLFSKVSGYNYCSSGNMPVASDTDFTSLKGFSRVDIWGIAGTNSAAIPTSTFVAGTLTQKFIVNGSNRGVGLYLSNPSDDTATMVAYLTNTYNTGWMVGDIKLAAFCDNTTGAITTSSPNRSVVTTNLVVTGTLTQTAVNSGSISAVSGFLPNATPTNANKAVLPAGVLDANTGTIFLSAWVNASSFAAQWSPIIATGGYGVVGAMRALYINPTGNVAGVTWTNDVVGNITLPLNTWSLISLSMRYLTINTVEFSMYVNGVLDKTGSPPSSVVTVTDTSWDISGGAMSVTGNYSSYLHGSLALARISTTVPTPEQILHMYETERKLFEPNAQALLPHSTSSAVVDLKPDPKSGMFVVENGAAAKGSSSNFTAVFKDLVRVDSAATGSTIATPVTTLSGNRVLAPAVDIGSELAAQVKPDKRSVMVYYTGTASLEYRAPMGMKITSAVAITTGVHVDLSLAANDKFDGFRYSTVVANGTKYQITLEAV